jgi:SAM-dependent methyltransferase
MGRDSLPPLRFACPSCAAPLDSALACGNCGRQYAVRDGIYRFLLPERQQALARFLEQYRQVREHDGYRSPSAGYYRALPQTPASDPQAATWRLRAASSKTLLRQAGMDSAAAGQGLAVLDLGAGNGWLSNRLTALGHTCAAVDWLDDAADGLGAAQHHATRFTRLQADFEHLPLEPGQFDRVIFNASLHYSTDIPASLGHALSMVRAGGQLAIIDSPTFHSAISAEQMLAGQRQQHADVAGEPISGRQGQGYLLTNALRQAGRQLGLELRYWPTHGSLSWALRRRWAGIKLRREPASFGLWLGIKRVPAGASATSA